MPKIILFFLVILIISLFLMVMFWNKMWKQEKERIEEEEKEILEIENRIFSQHAEKIRNKKEELDQDELSRLQRSGSIKMRILSISDDKKSAIIKSESGNTYTVSGNSCTCEDFKRNHKNCKHIYRFLVYTKQLDPNIYMDGYELPPIDLLDVDLNKYKGHNMSLQEYDVKALKIKTGKINTLRIRAKSEQAIEEKIPNEYEKKGFKHEIHSYPAVTESQYLFAITLGIELPEKCCRYDASALIGRKLNNDKLASFSLLDFAKDKELFFSMYEGENGIQEIILDNLTPVEKIAFFIVCVSKVVSGLWDFGRWEKMTEKAQLLTEDKKFINSYRRFSKYNLLHAEGLKNTNAFKIVEQELNNL